MRNNKDIFDHMDSAFDKNFNNGVKRGVAAIVALWIIGIVLNIAFWGGLIWFVVFLLNHYGVI